MHWRTIEGVALPKVTVATHGGIKQYLAPGHSLWAFFETPEGIQDIEAICRQGVYSYAVIGYNDLRAELQLPMRPSSSQFAKAPFFYSCSRLILAARASHMHPIDGVFNDPHDAAGFMDDCVAGRELGFAGKTLIHPAQIEATNAVYTPPHEEVEWARRVLEAVRAAGGGVATVDGKMVEEMHARQAQRILHRAALQQQPLAAAGDGNA
jgi:citrate lyase beta subunit